MIGVPTDTRAGHALSGPTPVRSARTRHAWIWLAAAGLIPIFLATAHAQPNVDREAEEVETDSILSESLVDVLVEGNTTIPREEISRHIKTRAGRPPSDKLIKEDVRALYGTRWFFSVEPVIRRQPDGPVLVFRVAERPILQRVEYHGNKKIKAKDLAGLTGLRQGGAFDVGINREACKRIESHYREKGFMFVQVKLEKGEDPEDRDVVFAIEEGPKVKVSQVNFQGNKFFSSALLRTKLKTSIRKVWVFGGKYDPATIPEDIVAIKEYYHSLGFFDVRIQPRTRVAKDKATVEIDYFVEEGPRYKVRQIEIAGNEVISEPELRKDMQVKENDFFVERHLNHDVEKVTNQYGQLGRIFAKIDAVPRFLEEPGMVDLVYSIEEDRPYRVRRINVSVEGEHPHTRESVVINRMVIKPGDLANPTLIKKSENRLKGAQIFAGAQPGQPDGPHINVVRGEDVVMQASAQRQGARSSIVRAQGLSEPPGAPGVNLPADGIGSPFDEALNGPPPGFVDLNTSVTETQTGRLMFGVGVNSNSGLVGSIVLDENNFDITRPPTNFQQVLDGTAFRGGGQQFRIEAVPGTQLSRYMLSWRDPFIFDTDYSLGTSGFYYTRYFPNWYETRLGGRIAVGKQLTPEWSGSLALRLEDVKLNQPTTPTPDILQKALGTNFLSTVRASLVHDTRDLQFLPGKGHYIEMAYEQGISQFAYPRGDLEGRQYFTLRERPDGGGRHILSLFGQLGFQGNQSPIFERYFAGGFQSLRGFAFYGVTPRENNVRIGGTFQALGTVEYMVPLTASNVVQAVVFTDFGTVQNQVSLKDFRCSVGAGLRLTIPAMGPVPIALDWAVPVAQQSYDTTQLFSFYVGVLR